MTRSARMGGIVAAMATVACAATAQTPARVVDLDATRALIARVVPASAAGFEVDAIPDSAGRDVFEVENRDGKVLLRGSSGVAIASALNWYLEHVGGVNASLPLKPIVLPTPLPPVPAPVRITTPYTVRYFFNYCTFSYSMAWWSWSDWQSMIDWMALKGINTPLAVTGQEGVWRLVLRDFGFNQQQIADFLVGPAYLPWGWMGNIDGLGGPLPDSWIDGHIALERQILARERSLGMTPVLQGFTGHVPKSITQVFPGVSHPSDRRLVGGVFRHLVPGSARLALPAHRAPVHRAADGVLRHRPPLRRRSIQRDRPAVQRLDLPGGDGDARSTTPMRSDDSSATWVLQGWFLYYRRKFWQDPQAEALLGAVPDDQMLVLDLWGDRASGVEGAPRLLRQAVDLERALQLRRQGERQRRPPADRRESGRGAPEPGQGPSGGTRHDDGGARDQPHRTRLRDGSGVARSRAGRRRRGRAPTSRAGTAGSNASAWSAWQLLLATAFKSSAQTGDFLAERPQFYVKGRSYRTEPIAPYDDAIMARALDSLLSAAPALGANDAYRYDVVNLTRQVLGQHGLPLVNRVERAYERKDRAAMLAAEGEIESLLRDLDELVGTRPEFLLGRWIADARRWGTTDAERRLYEWNARNIITLWGTKCTEGENDDLNLYAYKEWEGMFASYFLPRWKAFFQQLNAAFDAGTVFDRKPFAESSCAWEQAWSRDTTSFPTAPKGDAVAVARRLVAKWRGR